MACHHDEVTESHWIPKRVRPPRPLGHSTAGGKSAKELSDEQVEAIRAMSPEELETFVDEIASESLMRQAERTEAAASRRAWRYRMN